MGRHSILSLQISGQFAAIKILARGGTYSHSSLQFPSFLFPNQACPMLVKVGEQPLFSIVSSDWGHPDLGRVQGPFPHWHLLLQPNLGNTQGSFPYSSIPHSPCLLQVGLTLLGKAQGAVLFCCCPPPWVKAGSSNTSFPCLPRLG